MDFNFWFRVDVRNEVDCWEFMNQPSQRYGVYNLKIGGEYKSIRPHRYAWEQMNGPIPNALYVCHLCDNPKCCNPLHLWLGTNKDNQLDAVEKYGHWRIHPEESFKFGEDHHSAKLKIKQVQEIRRRYKNERISQIRLAEEYGVSQVAISKIVLRKSWKDIG